MDVVEHEHERVRRRKALEQLPCGAVAAVALVWEVALTGRREPRLRREHERERTADLVVERIAATRLEALQVLVDCIDEDPEGQVALELRRGSREHEVTACVRARDQLREKPALADSGLAHQLEHSGTRAIQLGKRAIEFAELVGAPNELLAKHGHFPC